MNEKCTKFEELFTSLSTEEFEKHISECSECKKEYEKQSQVSSLLNEVKMYYYSKRKNRTAKLRAACAIMFAAFSLISMLTIAATNDDLLDTLAYGDTLTAEELGFPVDSYGLLMVDE